ncbi:MAG: hypothetical protein CL575_10895 [Altererythrobacter sp.]|nr:hypothetical protein [Altererythrobacter sp.]MBK63424.1 hypothetical protein [Altererythrobacter sp.]|tara:strand:- start:17883 stop:20174 length:2292 start_codon:yes stop_codon:yes gene_type:complete
MVRSYTSIESQSCQIAALCAEVRSARNRAARARRADREAEYLNETTRLRRDKADRELERNLRFRVRVEDHEHPRISGRTARNLFHRPADPLQSAKIKAKWHDGSSIQSLYLQWSARGLSGSKARAWKPGEADRHARYILREDALEIGEDGWSTNIGSDRTEVVAFWRALEQVEALNRKNANVYISIILPLPHQLSAEGRSDLVDSIAAPLAARGLPFVAAQHLPDEGGDQRNYHLHLQVSCRPMVRVRPYEWEFSAATHAGINSPAGIRMMRRHFVRQMNSALEKAGLARRYTHLTRAERGEPPGEMKRGRGDQNRIAMLSRRRDDLERLCSWAKRLVALSQKTDALKNRLAAMKQRLQLAQRNELDQFCLNQVCPDLYHQRYVLLERLAGQKARLERASQFREELAARFDRHILALGIQRALGHRDRLTQAYEKLAERFEGARSTAFAERESLADGIAKGKSALAYFTSKQEQLTTKLQRAHLTSATRADPERLAAITNAVEEARQRNFIPLVRAEEGFAIHPNFAGEHDLVAVDRFEAESAVQELHAAKWHAMLNAIKVSHKGAEREPAVEIDGMLRQTKLEPELATVVEIVAADQEVQSALQKALAGWQEQQRLKEIEDKKSAELKASKAMQRSEAMERVKAAVVVEAESQPRGTSRLRAISADLEKMFSAVEAGTLSVVRRDTTIEFRAVDRELVQASRRIMATDIGRYAVQKLSVTNELRPSVDFSWSSWGHELPTVRPTTEPAPRRPGLAKDGWERD